MISDTADSLPEEALAAKRNQDHNADPLSESPVSAIMEVPWTAA